VSAAPSLAERPGEVSGRTVAATAGALVCFAANSLLCRAALGPARIDFASFTTVRLVSGAVVLWLLAGGAARARGRRAEGTGLAGSWTSAAALFLYAAAFSAAYRRIGAATGALVLFGTVQATMIGWGLLRREHPDPREWAGLLVSVSGLVALALPGLSAPDAVGMTLMAAAGVAWGVYSLRGRGTSSGPLPATAGNFVRTVPMTLALSLLALGAWQLSPAGVALAVASGSVASGLGYVVWYTALKGLSAARAAIVQLSVPVLAALGAVALLGERLSVRLVACAAAILGGVALALFGRR
jgi:drug/metabolite transporter (DMT)-like permease